MTVIHIRFTWFKAKTSPKMEFYIQFNIVHLQYKNFSLHVTYFLLLDLHVTKSTSNTIAMSAVSLYQILSKATKPLPAEPDLYFVSGFLIPNITHMFSHH